MKLFNPINSKTSLPNISNSRKPQTRSPSHSTRGGGGSPSPEPRNLTFISYSCTDLQENYISAGVSKVAREWNEQRRLIIRDALHKILLPVMESEARSELSQRARRFVVGECEKSLWRLAARAPYARKKADPDVSPSLRGCGWLGNEGFEDFKDAARM